jgi:hypothetical protein
MVDIVAFKNEISRRSLLQSVSFVAATAFSFECIAPNAASAQQTKLSQMLSKYQDTPKNGQQCSTCSRFVAPASCAIVVDPISPQGWCQFFVAKT